MNIIENNTCRSYLKIVLVSWIMVLILRVIEYLSIGTIFNFGNSLSSNELIGLCYDWIAANSLLTLLFPLYYLIYRISKKIANVIFLASLTLFSLLHYLILLYFFNQQKPLDTFLFRYSFDEMFFTVKTAKINYLTIITLIIGLIITVLLSNNILRKINFSKMFSRMVSLALLISLPAFIIIRLFFEIDLNVYQENKSIYFYTKSLNYFTSRSDNYDYSKSDATDYHKLFKSKNFISKKYPLLHEFDSTNYLRDFLGSFDEKPNIVILIVEGLNDDYIHDYRNVNLMPFLNKLKDKSLYWDHCFTLGERSYAVVPSLLGSLPYGEIGFTLMNKLPKHLTLTSILNENGYQTDFFYGQGSWFHNKRKFFKYNNIDLIVDNEKYQDKYKKIIVGNDNYFWGYNDKDLFSQAFEVIDTLGDIPRLDVYFTGTTHSPYIIADEKLYDEKFARISEKLKNDADAKFFDTYKLYFKTILFLDDALSDFFEKYRQRPEYENTIFVITGDHPMTEIPIANFLKRYHVPLIIYSDKLKQVKTFDNIVSHLDFYETILAFLKDYGVKVYPKSPAMGDNLFKSNDNIAFMDGNRDIADFYSNNYFISKDALYEVDTDFNITKIDNPDILALMKEKLAIIKKTSDYTSFCDRIIPDYVYSSSLGYELLASIDKPEAEKFDNDYFSLTCLEDITGCDTIVLDVSFDYKLMGEKAKVISKIIDSGGKILYNNVIGIGKEGSSYMSHLIIPVNPLDGSMKLELYINNNNLHEIEISNIRCSVCVK